MPHLNHIATSDTEQSKTKAFVTLRRKKKGMKYPLPAPSPSPNPTTYACTVQHKDCDCLHGSIPQLARVKLSLGPWKNDCNNSKSATKEIHTYCWFVYFKTIAPTFCYMHSCSLLPNQNIYIQKSTTTNTIDRHGIYTRGRGERRSKKGRHSAY